MPDPYAGARVVNIVQGEYDVSAEDDLILSTVLGSCVSACIYDELNGVGGMNHFLLPDAGDNSSTEIKYGSMAMELLINELLKSGAQRENMKCKLFGGASLGSLASNVGERNIEFARNYMKREGFPVVKEHLGGTEAMRLQFKPRSGHARVHMVAASHVVEARVKKPEPDMTLF